MAIFFESGQRRLIPNWRSFDKTAESGELNSVSTKNTITFSLEDIKDVVEDWNKQKTIAHAGDLISTAITANLTHIEPVSEAVNFIIENREESPAILLRIANSILNKKKFDEKKEDNIHENTLTSIRELHDSNFVQAQIRLLKNSLIRFPRNSIRRVELARMYSIIGQKEQAKKAMQIALRLDPENRFILRSAARFFAHINDLEEVHDALRKNESTKYDPWLASTEISVSMLRDRHSRFIDPGRKLINSNNLSNFDLTELTSSIATLELNNNNIKNARKLFSRSIINPNDNALAQAEWASNTKDELYLNIDFQKINNPYEAITLDKYFSEDWEEAVKYAQYWLFDLPYSKRPVLLGSFVSDFYLDNINLAIEFIEIGLVSNPNNPTLLNNLCYYLAKKGEPERALSKFKKLANIPDIDLSLTTKISSKATFGLINYRLGYNDLGRKFYLDAIEMARENKIERYMALAYLNLIREEILSGFLNIANHISQMDKVVEKLNDIHIKRFKERIINMYNLKKDK